MSSNKSVSSTREKIEDGISLKETCRKDKLTTKEGTLRVECRQNPLKPDESEPFTLKLASYMAERTKQLDEIYGQ